MDFRSRRFSHAARHSDTRRADRHGEEKVKTPIAPPIDSKLALAGFPSDENSSWLRGAAQAPALIRAALFSDATNLFTEDGTDLGAEALLYDAGDADFRDGADPFEQIEQAVLELAERGLRPICLGGDHAITWPIVRAMARRYPDLTILDFDAHPDLYPDFQGSRRSHACPFARIMEEGLARRLVQVGIRTMNAVQRAQAEHFGVEVIAMKDLCDLLPDLRSPVYLSFDLDVLDPACAPGVSHREPGGLSTRQAIAAIQSIRAQVVGADIVEFNPRNDPLNLTAQVCAKLVKEIAARMLE
jgi:arginase